MRVPPLSERAAYNLVCARDKVKLSDLGNQRVTTAAKLRCLLRSPCGKPNRSVKRTAAYQTRNDWNQPNKAP